MIGGTNLTMDFYDFQPNYWTMAEIQAFDTILNGLRPILVQTLLRFIPNARNTILTTNTFYKLFIKNKI